MFQVKWIWQNMKGYRKLYIFALCSTVILAASALVNSLIIEEIMDTVFKPVEQSGIATPSLINQLVLLVAVLIGFTLLRTSFAYVSVLSYEKCSQQLIYKLRNDLYVNMQHQDMMFYSKNRTGDLMTRLTGDMDMVRHTVCYVFRMLIDCIVLFLSTTICFLIKDPLLALSLLVVTPFIFLFTTLFAKKVGPLYVDLRESMSQLNTSVQENISGNRVVKAFAQEDFEINKFVAKNAEFKRSNLKASLLWLKFAPYIDGLSQALSVAVLLVGGYFLIIGRISIGTFTLFNGLCWTLTNPMRMIGMLINDLQRFFASASKIVELFYSRSTIQSRHDARVKSGRFDGKVEFKDVDLNLNSTTVLKDINITINPGETVAIMGPTGCGKTSLINLIPRFFDVSHGEILIDGIPINRWNMESLRSNIGLATQEVFLFSDTVDGNIAYGDSQMSEEEVAKYANAASVNFISKLSNGFDTVIGERGTGLSGGQKQRIALARAIAVKPAILILDDTTSAVDLETEKYIQNQLNSLEFACTKIIVAQRISTTKNADKIVIMEKGQVIQIGTHDELSKVEGYYREVFLLQTGEEDTKGGALVG